MVHVAFHFQGAESRGWLKRLPKVKLFKLVGIFLKRSVWCHGPKYGPGESMLGRMRVGLQLGMQIGRWIDSSCLGSAGKLRISFQVRCAKLIQASHSPCFGRSQIQRPSVPSHLGDPRSPQGGTGALISELDVGSHGKAIGKWGYGDSLWFI